MTKRSTHRQVILRVALILMMGLMLPSSHAKAQSYELQRLILDIQKLSELKKVLADLYKGYKILETGYSTVKGISEGSFHLHEAFLDGLWLVSPTVRQYPAVQRIIRNQLSMVTEYRAHRARFAGDEHLRQDELIYLSGVYNHLLDQSTKNLEQLMVILSPRALRMNDAERLAAIDGLDKQTSEQLLFLRQFNNSTGLLMLNRGGGAGDIQTLQQYQGIR